MGGVIEKTRSILKVTDLWGLWVECPEKQHQLGDVSDDVIEYVLWLGGGEEVASE